MGFIQGHEEYTTSVIGFINKCIDDVIPQPEAMDYRQHPHQAKRLELPLSRSGTLIQTLIRNPAMYSDEQSNINTGLRLNPTTLALTLVRCGRACKLLQTTKGNPAVSCPVIRAYQIGKITYARFEASSTEACMRTPAVPDNFVIVLSVADVSKTFKQVNIHKAAGPEGCVPRACVAQPASVFIDIFNLFLTESNSYHHSPCAQESKGSQTHSN